MNEELFENPVELRTAVPAPHFDDRRVVRRAQPVVPLNEIRTKLRLRRLVFIGGAFAIAVVLGAVLGTASALLAAKFKRITATTQISKIEEQPAPATPEVDTTAAAQLDLPPAETPQVEEAAAAVEEPAKPIVTAPKRPEPLAQRPRVVNRDRETLSERDARRPSQEEQLEQIRDAVLYERWQERRMRRAARRERRNRGDRDLTHVDEIFEGPRRPERP